MKILLDACVWGKATKRDSNKKGMMQFGRVTGRKILEI